MKEGVKAIDNGQLTEDSKERKFRSGKWKVENFKEVYKKTELGWIPNEWNVDKIGNISELVTKGTTPSTIGFDFEEDGVNYIRAENINLFGNLEGDFLKISKECNEKLSRSKIFENDILVSIVGYYLGKTAIVSQNEAPANTNQNIAIIRINNKNYSNKYIKIVFESNYLKKYINKILTIGAQPSLSLEQIKNFYIPIPPLKEQQKIAEILSTVDSQIDDTDKLIEKTKELKKGLMQRLLTKGIGHTEFKKTLAGNIPEKWEIYKLEDITEKITDGTHKTPVYTDTGIPFLRVTDIQKSEIDFENIKYISEDEHKELIKRCKPEKGDILYSKNGTIGIPKIIDWDYEFSIFVSLCLIKIKKENSKINNMYLEQYLKSDSCFHQIRLRSKQGTVTNLHLEEIRELRIPIPKTNEQEKIADILSSVDNEIIEYENRKTKLEELKNGLMQQLLTGKIRVKV